MGKKVERSGRRSSARLDRERRRGFAALTAQRAMARMTGARICFGKPVQASGHTVVPVASLRAMGGMGFGESPSRPAETGEPPAVPAAPADAESNTGGGGGGLLEARPIGYIDMGPDGVRFVAIEHPSRLPRALGLAAIALGATAAARALRGGGSDGSGVARLRRRSAAVSRSPRRLLGR